MKPVGKLVIKLFVVVYIVSSLCDAERWRSPRQVDKEDASSREAEPASLTDNENTRTESQLIVAEPDDLKDLEESLPDIQRGIIKEFNHYQSKIAPDAIRYINDEESLPTLQRAVIKEFMKSPSNAVPDAIRYTNDAAQEAMHQINEEIAGQLTNMMFFESEGREKTSGDDDEQKHSEDVTIGISSTDRAYKLEAPLQSVTPFLISQPAIGGRSKNEQNRHMENSLKLEISRKEPLERKSSSSNVKQPIFTFAARKTHSKAKPNLKDIQELGVLVETNQKHKYPYKHHKTIKFVKADSKKNHWISKSTENYTSKTPDSTGTAISTAHTSLPENFKNIAKRDKIELGLPKHKNVNQKGRHYSNDDLIKRTAIFKDIAIAFRHMDQKKYLIGHRAKKSSLETPEKEIQNNYDIAKKPVKGGFTSWTDWSECSESYGSNAIKMRMRVCTNPPPANGGQDCKGWRFDVKYCTSPVCKDHISEGAKSEKKPNEGVENPKPQQTEAVQEQLENENTPNNSVLNSQNTILKQNLTKEENVVITGHPLTIDTKEKQAETKTNQHKNTEKSPEKKQTSDKNEKSEQNQIETTVKQHENTEETQETVKENSKHSTPSQNTGHQNTKETPENNEHLTENAKSEETEIEATVKQQNMEETQKDKQHTENSTQNTKQDTKGIDNKQNSTHTPSNQTSSNTSWVVEKMFNEVVHQAFDTAKNKQEHTTKKNDTEKSKYPPITIHSDPGLLLSENEIDTIDDAPDPSQLNNESSSRQQTGHSQSHDQKDNSSSKNASLHDDGVSRSKEKGQPHSIDGTYDSVNRMDEKDKQFNGTEDLDLAMVANEILKRNDNDAILKALLAEEKNAETIVSYPHSVNHNQQSPSANHDEAGGHGNVKTLENDERNTKNVKYLKNEEKNDKSVKTFKNEEKSDENVKTLENEEKSDENVKSVENEEKSDENRKSLKNKEKLKVYGNRSSSGNHKSDENMALENESGKKQNANGDENTSDNMNDDFEESGSADDMNKCNSFASKDTLSPTTDGSGEDLELNGNEKSDIHQGGANDICENSVQNIDFGNLHALNALVEILAEHEKNESKKNNGTALPSNGTLNASNASKASAILNATIASGADNISSNNSHKIPGETNTAFSLSIGKNALGVNNRSASSRQSKKDLPSVNLPSNNTKTNREGENSGAKVSKQASVTSLDNYEMKKGLKRFNVTGERGSSQPTKSVIPGNATSEPSVTEVADDAITDGMQRYHHFHFHSRNSSSEKINVTKSNALFNVLKEVIQTINKLKDSTANSTRDKPKNVGDEKESKNEGFSPWTAWTACSSKCGLGSKTRARRCLSQRIPCEGLFQQNQSCHVVNCPVDGGFTEWSPWSSCSASCGEGAYKVRNRTCTNPIARFGGKPCNGSFEEKHDCHLKTCSNFVIAGKIGGETVVTKHKEVKREKGVWGTWSAWSKCSRTCGGDGHAKRERWCLPGKNCTGTRYETMECHVKPCPVDGGYAEWTQWSPCTPTCGVRAYRIRRRYCTNPPPSHGGHYCFDASLETMPCKTDKCPVDGGFSRWSLWSSCSKTCNTTALSRRERQCTNPEPSGGGKPCQGNTTEVKECGKQPCPIDGGVTHWSAWSKCPNVTCGSSLHQSRVRTCQNPRPQFDGKGCKESLLEKRKCSPPQSCPVNGWYSDWSAWSACPKGCKVSALSHRRRHCNNPKPQNGGQHCKGNDFQTRPCATTNCPVNGGFTGWSAWSSCSKECGHTSIRSRERHCSNPAPLNGGKHCTGSKFQISVCKSHGCPRDGNFTEWSGWTECPKCRKGFRKRVRTCSNPPPINDGKDCKGPTTETIACPFKKCRDAGYSQWSQYGRCSKTCGGGAKMRRRMCDDEARGCDGKYVQLKPCNTHSCVLGSNDLYHPTPTSLCGYNPCKISTCISRQDALCVTSPKCLPVFFDKRGNIIESCQGDSAVLTSSPEISCGIDPCQISGCYSDEASKCYVTTGCTPLFVDSKGKKLQCKAGLLKVPPSLVCGTDPCEGMSCDADSTAHCVADYSCEPVFISSQNEILDDCTDSEDQDVDKENDNNPEVDKKQSKKLNKSKEILQTNEDIKSMNTQLKDLLESNDESSNVEATANFFQKPVLTPEEQNELEYRLQQFKKRNGFERPKEDS